MSIDKRALVVLSGGQDSTICLFAAIHKYGRDNVYALTFDYGQRHHIELEAARKIGRMAGIVDHEFVDLKGVMISTSPLLSSAVHLEQYDNFAGMIAQVGQKTERTFVPVRNALFLSVAANRAYAHRCQEIYIGVSQEDTANYPDTTTEFVNAFTYTLNIALGTGDVESESWIKLNTPLLYKTKAEAIKLALTFPGCWGALAFSHTSYAGEYPPTDKNHANILRAKGFEEAGFADPLVIRAYVEGLMQLPETSNYDLVRQLNISKGA